MTNVERYEALKVTLKELEQDLASISSCSDGASIPYQRSMEEQVYSISFSNRCRKLLFSNEAVQFALNENRVRIKECILYYARQNIEKYLKEAKQEVQRQLFLLKQEKIIVDVKVD